MLDDKQLEHHVRELIMDICEVMYRRGYEMVSVGAMMRLVGVGEDRAQAHDDEFFDLGEQFEQMIKQRKTDMPKKAPPGVTLH